MSVLSPLRGTVVSVEVAQGDLVRQGAPIAIVESMKMEHVVEAPQSGIVGRVAVGPGDTVAEGALLVHLDPVPAAAEVASEARQRGLGLRARRRHRPRRHPPVDHRRAACRGAARGAAMDLKKPPHGLMPSGNPVHRRSGGRWLMSLNITIVGGRPSRYSMTVSAV